MFLLGIKGDCDVGDCSCFSCLWFTISLSNWSGYNFIMFIRYFTDVICGLLGPDPGHGAAVELSIPRMVTIFRISHVGNPQTGGPETSTT